MFIVLVFLLILIAIFRWTDYAHKVFISLLDLWNGILQYYANLMLELFDDNRVREGICTWLIAWTEF